MENNAIDILKTFSKEDIKQFEVFLNSPFFNKSRKLTKLYKILLKYYPHFNSKFLTEQKLSIMISPGLNFNRYTMNRLFYDLYICEEKYLLMKSLDRNSFQSHDLLRGEFFRRRLFQLIDKNIKYVKKNIETKNSIDADHYLNMFKLSTDICNLFTITTSKSNSSQIKKKTEGNSERAKFITYFFVTEMIREYENLLTLEKTYNTVMNLDFVKDIFTKFDFQEVLKMMISSEDNSPYTVNLSIYLALLLAFSNKDNERYYFNYKKKLILSLKDLSADEKRFHIGRLIRYCMLKREELDKQNKFHHELFNVYEFILKNKYYRSSVMNYMPVELYRSILMHALRLKKYKWTIKFIKKYSKYLNPDKMKNIYYYSNAQYYFHRKMYKDARHNLQKIIFDEFMYKIDYKNLMLITSFELKEYESVINMIDSYKHFLKNDDTLSGKSRISHRRFINMTYALVMHKTSVNKVIPHFLKKEYVCDLPYSDWITEKFAECGIDITLQKNET
ncbi:MAG: hypothetical protein IPM96_11555 [Ignavibacteria bacterium]|nr:hypothetical protein [Ignavibacteria bacterium]